MPGSGGSAGTGGTSGAGGAADSPGSCSLRFTFTTENYGGRYQPANVSAVWVTNAEGVLVRTLEENGHIRQRHLLAWTAASGGDLVDVVSGATNRAPRQHLASWNCTDASGASVPPGKYTVSAEFTSDNAAGPLLALQIDVGGGPWSVTPPDQMGFTGISLSYE